MREETTGAHLAGHRGFSLRRTKEGQQAGLGLQPPLCPPLGQLWWRGRLRGQLPKVSSCARLL